MKNRRREEMTMNNGRPQFNLKSFGRVIKMLFRFYPRLVPITGICILFSSVVSSIPPLFQQKIIEAIKDWYPTGNWEAAARDIVPLLIVLISLVIAVIMKKIPGVRAIVS